MMLLKEKSNTIKDRLKELQAQFVMLQKISNSLNVSSELNDLIKIGSDFFLEKDKDGISLIYEFNKDNNTLSLKYYYIDPFHRDKIEGKFSFKSFLGRQIEIERLKIFKDSVFSKRSSIISPKEMSLRYLFPGKDFFEFKRVLEKKKLVSLIIIPLFPRNLVERIMLIYTGKRFIKSDLSFISIIAQQLDLAIERVLQYRRGEEKYRELGVLYRLGNKISSLMRLDEILKIIMDGIKEIIDYDIITIGLLSKDRKSFDFYEAQSEDKVQMAWFKSLKPEISEEFIRWIDERNFSEPIFVDIDSDNSPLVNKYIADKHFRYFLNIPMVSENRLIGVITVGRKNPEKFRDRSIKTMTIIASQVAGIIERAKEYQENLDRKNHELEILTQKIRLLKDTNEFDSMIGRNIRMQNIFQIISNIASSDAPILIQGETGTGKELIAKSIHFNSNRRDNPFIKINCASIPETLLESELFGHVKGAFTGAYRDRIGKFESANLGTLLLDEIGETPFSVQAKLLRVLQEMEFEKVGGNKTIKVDVRIIAATNQNLEESINTGKFRKDIFYRLNVFCIDLPPLRERVEDIPLLAMHFLKVVSKKYQKNVKRISSEALGQLISYTWPGNVRELENTIERAVLMADDEIIRNVDVNLKIGKDESDYKIQNRCFYGKIPYNEAIKLLKTEFEKEYFRELLIKYEGNMEKVIKDAKIDRKTLYLKMKQYGLKRELFKKYRV
ncbi:MAG: sigma-54-dependent Fis family transcriptional regulator [Thermodesulfobacteriota bacterium]|nr:sigma-54-dependent Fis family transcriptional regulator [Thermodesulfobacteriota bacterium]